ARADTVNPGVEVQLAIELDVAAAQADARAVDAGEVGFAADACAEAGVERVIPDVQLPDRRRVYSRDEIHRVVRYVNDVFVRADAVKFGQFVMRQLGGLHFQAPARMREAHDGALR